MTRTLEPDTTSLHADLERSFHAVGARAPRILWSPDEAELAHPLLRDFAKMCHQAARPDGTVPRDRMTPASLGPVGDWLMLVEIEGKGGPFRYAHYGRRIAEHFGHDMTGRTTADFTGHIAGYFTALYATVAERREWVLSEHEPPGHVFVRLWRRLIVPISDADGAICGFAVANVAENELRAGLELMVDPVFVLASDQTIHYSNKAAQRFFGINPPAIAPATLHDVTGISINPGRSPDDLIARGETADSLELVLRSALVERLAMTVSAARHRGQGFYVVVMRLIGS